MKENKQEVPFELMQFPSVKGSDIHARTPEQDKEDIKNWIEQGSPTKEEEKEDEMLIWFVMAYGALEALCKLKKIKDRLDLVKPENQNQEFVNEYADYVKGKNMAWYAANQVIELWKKSDYGANLLVNEFVLVKANNAAKSPNNEIEPDRFPETLTEGQLRYYNEVSGALKRDYEEKMWLLKQKIISDKDGG